MKLKDIINQLNENEIKIDFVEPDNRSRTIYIKNDPYNENYLIISSVAGKDKITFHKTGIDKIITALEKLK